MSDVVAVRFPDRQTEFLYGTRLKVGDTLTRQGEEWVVTAIAEDGEGQAIATVRLADVTAHVHTRDHRQDAAV
jgi:hypothetical protein